MRGMEIFLLLIGLFFVVLWRRSAAREDTLKDLNEKQSVRAKDHEATIKQQTEEIGRQHGVITSLAPFVEVRDAHAEAQRIIDQAREAQALSQAELTQARQVAEAEISQIKQAFQKELHENRAEATELRRTTLREQQEKRAAIEDKLIEAGVQATKIIEEAKAKAESIAGDAFRALQESDDLQGKVKALKNVIEGYGDRYVVPTHGLLDDLAESYSFSEAGLELKQARERTKLMVQQGRAATCDYVEPNRRGTAIRFLIDAFNGKVDTILTRAKVNNYGTLEQEIRDAGSIVNLNGDAFRKARVTSEYVDARIEELKWAVRLHELREREKEQQRQIRERIREEELARREYERAMKEAAREEDIVRKALEKAQERMLKASDEQRLEFEEQIQRLNERLIEAEQKNQRALSMAQQTKAGHVYVISNVGSFGEHVYKVGMTRRLEPLDRVRELGDASVPFAFDVHAMIWSENAPALEATLHRHLVQSQVNKVNPRKEFFRVSVAQIREVVEDMELAASWTMAAEAREYRESLAIEQRIAVDEAARATWLHDQLVYETRIAADVNDEVEAPDQAQPLPLEH